MILQTKYVRDKGDQRNERIVFSVLKDGDVGEYAIFDTTFTADNRVSNQVRFTFWFPDKRVKAGDLVIVYTKNGHTSQKTNDSGVTSHFFYWGLDRTIWNKDGDCAVLVWVDSWKATRV